MTGWRRASRCDFGECVEVQAVDGWVLVRDSKLPDLPPLAFHRCEWEAFVAGVKRGEFDPDTLSRPSNATESQKTPKPATDTGAHLSGVPGANQAAKRGLPA
ncbi:DUF397 domain-containing protein [Pseudonocardia hispaniensis]|uniref:DUF397 domain-containing protein n=1 Tax=Pseudonocardia hispaniensis TaxID=904933 RepID=A0ABW1J8K1_9PSEU